MDVKDFLSVTLFMAPTDYMYYFLFYYSQLLCMDMPSTMLRSIIVSIPKDQRQSLTTTDNYRGNSLCSFCKIPDLIIKQT